MLGFHSAWLLGKLLKMVNAWLYDSMSEADPREKHQKSPNTQVSISDLENIGILFWKFEIDEKLEENVQTLMKVCKSRVIFKERCYKNKDVV